MRTLKIFIGGINSTGKTTLLNALTSLNASICPCYGSTEFIKWLNLSPNDYKSLEKLSDNYKNYELEKMIECLIKKISKQRFAAWTFVGHFGRIKKSIIVPAIGKWISNFDLIILLTAEPQIIIDRLKKDSASNPQKRNKIIKLIYSSQNPINTVSELLDATQKISKKISLKYKIPLLILNSSKLTPRQLSKKIIKYLGLEKK